MRLAVHLVGGAAVELEVARQRDSHRRGPASAACRRRALRAAPAARYSSGRPRRSDAGSDHGRIGEGVLKNIDLLAELEARDVGKPLKQARADVEALARYFEFYGAAADKVHGDTIPYRTGFTAITLHEPHGVTGHIIPWNYPMQIIGRSLGAALAMGNAVRAEAGRGSLPHGDRVRPHRRGGGLAARRAQPRHRDRRGGRRGACPAIPASTTFPSRARSRPARWSRRPPRAMRCR